MHSTDSMDIIFNDRENRFGPLSFSQQVARTERTPSSLNRNGFIRIEGGAVGGYGESTGCFVAETSFYDYHRWRRGRGGKSSSYIPVYPFELVEEVDSFSALPGQTRGGSMRREVGGYIYVLYVYRSGSITDTREILTQDGIPPPINFALMNGNGINKWLERVSVRFSIRFSWNGNFRFRATLLKTLLKGKYRDGRILR